MEDLLEECSPENARFFERASDLAREMGFEVGRGNTSSRLYYAVRPAPNCGFVSFSPNELEIYFHRLCDRAYLNAQQAARLEQWLQERGFRLCDRHRHPEEIKGWPARFFLADLDADRAQADREEIFDIYREVLERVRALAE